MEVPFGKMLQTLLKQYNGNGRGQATALAKFLGVDPSLISKWVREPYHVPRLNSDYVEKIGAFLELTPFELEQLKEAQIQSIKANKSVPRRAAKANSHKKQAVEDLIRFAQGSGSIDVTLSAVPIPQLLAHEISVFHGEETFQAAESLIRGILDDPNGEMRPHGEILLSSQGIGGIDRYPDLFLQWQKTLAELLSRGWNVTHLWKLDADLSRSVSLVKDMLGYLKYGNYQPYCFEELGVMRPPFEMLIVPGRAAMLMFDIGGDGSVNAGLFTKDAEAIKLLQAYFEPLKQKTHPLLKHFTLQERELYLKEVESAEIGIGSRFLIKCFGGLSALTQPIEWFHRDSEWARLVRLPGSEIATLIDHRRRCFEAFESNIKRYPYRDISTQHSVREMIMTGIYYPYYDMEKTFVASLTMRQEHLRHIITLLRKYPRYEIALLDEEDIQNLPSDAFWEVTSDRYVIMGARIQKTDGQEMHINVSINDPMIAQAFSDYFAELWTDNINPMHRDKEYIIWFLERLLDDSMQESN